MCYLCKFHYGPRLEYITQNEWYAVWYVRIDGIKIIHTIWIQLSLGLLTLVFQNKNIWYQTERAAADFNQ